MKAKISDISYFLPAVKESLEQLASQNPGWDVEKIFEKTGIRNRHLALPGQTAVDLAAEAVALLLPQPELRASVDLLILVTQSADYFLPTSACILQDRLTLPRTCMAFDINLGCSGFVYALATAGALVNVGQVQKAVVVCADTYSRYVSVCDRTSRPIFSDAASATLIEPADTSNLLCFEFGTDGSGYDRLIVRAGGARLPPDRRAAPQNYNLEMAGTDVYIFTMTAIPAAVLKILKKAGLSIDDIDQYIFHQASRLVVDGLIKKLGLPRERVFENYENIGNTVSSTVPIALKDAAVSGRVRPGDLVMLIGFGVGLSWGAAIIKW